MLLRGQLLRAERLLLETKGVAKPERKRAATRTHCLTGKQSSKEEMFNDDQTLPQAPHPDGSDGDRGGLLNERDSPVTEWAGRQRHDDPKFERGE
jgi:hypothetical protein